MGVPPGGLERRSLSGRVLVKRLHLQVNDIMGVDIETLAAGDGSTFPKPGQKVTCHYVLTLQVDHLVGHGLRSQRGPRTDSWRSNSYFRCGTDQCFVNILLHIKAKYLIRTTNCIS